jgi:hypothetical protein
MKLLYGEQLVKELRKLSDNVKKRLWIAVPYIGSPTAIRRILGKQWFDNPSVSVKLLTDTSDLACIDTEAVRHFYDRGEVKTLTGLHAKIYIIDDNCLISSANLTNTAFSRRHEIGILCNSSEAKQVLEIFIIWWKKSENVKPNELNKIFSKKRNSKEEQTGSSLPILFSLPEDPGSFVKNLAKRFLNYDRLVADYEDFAKKYSSIQRIWKNKPLYFEIDGLFNYLYHEAPRTPSKIYQEKKPRKLSQVEQMKEIRKWAKNYKEWNETEKEGDDIEWRMSSSKTLKKLLAPNRIMHLSRIELDEVFRCLNSLNSYPINRTKILNPENNSLRDIREGLNQLVNSDAPLAARMDFCNGLKNLGSSSMNEIIGFMNPTKYPLINKNSNCGLRFFGYQIRAYY